MLYVVAQLLHVLAGVLIIGLVGAVPLTARLARTSSVQLTGTERILGALLRALQVGVVTMLLTGALLDILAAGAFHRTAWFKASVALLALIGVSLWRARTALRRGFAPGGARESALRRLEQWGWTMFAAVALITILMQTRAFS
jgi:hypothetical protein